MLGVHPVAILGVLRKNIRHGGQVFIGPVGGCGEYQYPGLSGYGKSVDIGDIHDGYDFMDDIGDFGIHKFVFLAG